MRDYAYFISVVDNTSKTHDIIEQFVLSFFKLVSPILISAEFVIDDSRPHTHIIVFTSKPIKYAYVASRLKKGFSMRIYLLRGKYDIKLVKKYIRRHKGRRYIIIGDKVIKVESHPLITEQQPTIIKAVTRCIKHNRYKYKLDVINNTNEKFINLTRIKTNRGDG